MSEELDRPKNFEEKMRDRIRDSIGDLISDEELTKLIERGINETFFEERIERDRYNSINGRKPPLIAEIVKELLTEDIKIAVAVYMENNKDKMNEMVEKILQNGIANALTQAIDRTFYDSLRVFGESLRKQIQGN